MVVYTRVGRYSIHDECRTVRYTHRTDDAEKRKPLEEGKAIYPSVWLEPTQPSHWLIPGPDGVVSELPSTLRLLTLCFAYERCGVGFATRISSSAYPRLQKPLVALK